MIRLAISVEGRTEEEFVNNVLAEHLWGIEVYPTPILLGRARGRANGGNVSLDRLVSEMADLLRSFDAVTSFVDFYGFRRKGNKTVDDLEEDMNQQISRKLGRHWHPEKVFPYIQKHDSRGCYSQVWMPLRMRLMRRKSLLRNCGVSEKSFRRLRILMTIVKRLRANVLKK